MTSSTTSIELPNSHRWTLAAHTVLPTAPADWRNTLAEQLGHRPRRLGEWTEFAMHGAMLCLRDAGEAALPTQARLRLASCSGPVQAQADALAQLREGLPMPFAFMHSQPAITLASLAQALCWRGDAAFVSVREAHGLAELCLRGARAEGVLIGRVESGPQGLSGEWWRWRA